MADESRPVSGAVEPRHDHSDPEIATEWCQVFHRGALVRSTARTPKKIA